MPLLNTSDRRMLELMDILIELGISESYAEFSRVAGVLKQNITQVRKKKTGFRAVSVERVCKHFHINSNWVMGMDKHLFFGKNNTAIVTRMINKVRSEGYVNEYVMKYVSKRPTATAPKVRQKSPTLN